MSDRAEPNPDEAPAPLTPAAPSTVGKRLIAYDRSLRRLWIGGQRLHHGVTGIALAGSGLLSMGWRRRMRRRRGLIWTLAGGALIAHDWKDRAVWFRRDAGAGPLEPRPS